MAKVKEKTKKRGTSIVLPRQEIPESWKKAFGMLKGRKGLIDPLKYQREIRKGWEVRFKRQIRLANVKKK